jgi:hypothetical protein
MPKRSLTNTFTCEYCDKQTDEKAHIVRFVFRWDDGAPGLELFYLCQACGGALPRINPTRRNRLEQLFYKKHPSKRLLAESVKD